MIKAYLLTTRLTEASDSYEGKMIFKHVQIRLVASNELLMCCGPLPGWLRKKCIYAIDTFDDKMCAWHCLAIYQQKDIKRSTESVTKVAFNLARELALLPICLCSYKTIP